MSQIAAPISAVWLVRARGGENAPYAIENNCAVCSFGEFPDLSGCADLQDIKERLRPGWSHLNNLQFGSRAGQCHQFALEINIGDLIFIPISPERKAAIGKVVGAYRYRPDAPEMCCHQRPVEWKIIDFPYYRFPDEIRGLLTSGRTVAKSSVKNARKLLLAAITGKAITQENRGRTIASLTGFTRKIDAIFSESKHKFLVYRGHHSHKFTIYPSVLRRVVHKSEDGNSVLRSFRKSEDNILRELIASLPDEFSSDASTLDQLARAQHYSLPTRLLDVTTNPLAALYFAAQGKQEIRGQVIAFRVDMQKVKFFDSDTVSCIANLAHLSASEKGSIDSPESKSIDRLLQFIRVEKPYFKDRIDKKDLQTVLCVKPKMNSRRLLAQSGAFLIFGMADSLDKNPIEGIEFDRIGIDGKFKEKILRELEHVGIHEGSMFPEIETKARYIRSKNIKDE